MSQSIKHEGKPIMDLSIVGTILGLVVSNGSDIEKIEQATGGLSGLVAVGQQLENLWKLYQSGGVDAVLQKGGADVEAILSKIGIPNIAAVMPPAGNLLSAYQAKQPRGSGS